MSEQLLESLPKKLHFAGQWMDAANREQFDVVNPATETVIARVANGSPVDGIHAVDAASAAAVSWAGTSPRDRAEVMRKVFDSMSARADEIATVISLEQGKTLSEGHAEVSYAAEFFRWYSEEAPRLSGHFMPAPSGGNNIVVGHKPAGIALLITPWNFPAAMATRKIAPAIAAGCTVILKPASETPLTALLLAEILQDAGLPDGVVNVVPSNRSSEICNRILDDERVKLLSFTGSTEVGRLLLAKSSERVVNCSMELGGNAPFVVLPDADMDVAIDSAMVAKFRNAGESCIGANRFLVHNSIRAKFASRLAAAAKSLKMGPGLDSGMNIGPLVNARTCDKVERLVNDAVARGAKLLTGGKRPSGPGFFFEPTVIDEIAPEAEIAHAEIFGPVAPIFGFDTTDEAIERANSTIFGLAAYVVGSTEQALSVAQRIDAGVIGVNRGYVSDPAAPFGGMKQSGIGREGSHDGIHEFLEKQYIAVSW